MRITSDSYFTIGTAHASAGRPCQDYAGTRDSAIASKAVVSDGCSTGGRTDVGSRVVVLQSLRTIPLSFKHQFFHLDLFTPKCALGLLIEDLLATHLAVTATTEEGWFEISGDGVVALRMRNGQTRITRFEWKDNMPYYPAYYYDESRGPEFYRRQSCEDEQSAFTAETFNDDGSRTLESFDAVEGACIRQSFDVRAVEFAAVFSDGVTQIDGVDWKDAVREFLQFRTTGGEFVKRRMMFGLRTMKANGSKGPVDDLACAVIHVEHDDEG